VVPNTAKTALGLFGKTALHYFLLKKEKLNLLQIVCGCLVRASFDKKN
jgi:lipid-A-disaccharide synthase-like uncharacterized protein